MRKFLFVDRDGTLIEEPDDFQLDRLDKIRLVEGVIPALLKLKESGYLFAIVSNQDGLGTTTFPHEHFQPVHDFIANLFASQGIHFTDTLVCPHFSSDHCACRKPKTGLLTSYLKDKTIDWACSAMIGDRTTDVALAEAIGVRGFQLNTGGGPWSWASIATYLTTQPRQAWVQRRTKETDIKVKVNLDGSGQTNIQSGIGFFDHMIEQLGRHSNIDINLEIDGDLQVDEHHSIEDAGLALGEAIRQALSDKYGIGRYGFCLPMDECRADALIDLSGRSVTKVSIPFTTDRLGDFATEMVAHFFESFASAAGMNLHVRVTDGNNHHMAEASFKCVARALKQAIALTDQGKIPSTKGQL